MAASGEQLTTITDVITATAAANSDIEELRAELEAHALLIPTEDALLPNRGMDRPRAAFLVQPSEASGRQLTARYVERDGHAETLLDERPVTRDNPFIGQRYDYRYKGAELNGRFEFQRDVRSERSGLGYGQDVVKSWVLGAAVRRLAEIDITETRSGLLVAEWKDGEVVQVAGRTSPDPSPVRG